MILSRKDYVKDQSALQNDKYFCDICMDICCEPVICLGPCKSLTCRKCAALWSSNNAQIVSCPRKCSNPWKYTLSDRLTLPMTCPYSKQCQIPCIQDFQKHMSSCQYQPPLLLQEFQLRNKFQCANHHELHFFVSSFNEMTESKCSHCGEKEVVKSYCPKCDLKYCCKCRVPLCAKDGCPLGHEMHRRIPSKRQICDICGMAPSLLQEVMIYQDMECNFDVCEFCYHKLPETLKDNPILKNLKAKNQKNLCLNRHPLKKFHPAKQKCNFCQKQKLCWKTCDECSTYYCLDCKMPRISNKGYCQCSHEFEDYGSVQICSACQQNCRVYSDTACQVHLCGRCICKYIQVSNYSKKLKQKLYCSKNHLLVSSSTMYCQCSGCKTKKRLALYCPQCNPHQYYCYKCRRIDTSKTCYEGEELKEVEKDEINCMVCGKVYGGKAMECMGCGFIQCGPCCRNQEVVEKGGKIEDEQEELELEHMEF